MPSRIPQHLCSPAGSWHIFLPPRLAFLPRLQVRLIAIKRIVVQVEDARVARTLAAIFWARTRGRHGPWIVVLHQSVVTDFLGARVANNRLDHVERQLPDTVIARRDRRRL